MTPTLQLLGATRLTKIMRTLVDVRERAQNLLFLRRTPVVSAEDSEIMAKFTGYVTIADMIADDQRAVTYQNAKLSFESTNIPNLKHGSAMTQAMLNQLQALRAGGVADMGLFSSYENRVIDDLRLGVEHRIEALLVAMAVDSLTYDRFGIKMTNVSFGMPSDLKVTPSTGWDTAGSATPVADIQALELIASVRYGQVYNRLTMSTQAFRYMVATTEFQNKAKVFLQSGITFTNLSVDDLATMRGLAERTLGKQIELYDARYWTQGSNGALTSAPFLPITKVVLSNSNDDNNPQVRDFANGVVTESIVAGLVDSSVVGQFSGPMRGPVSYATAPGDLNPPQITYWGVARGFPRKHVRTETAVLTVGAFSDAISTAAPL